ncbi:MAG: NAD-dependent epimerase/dehydratase family protein [Elusimicrobia bacterium]|nr:NAD-dependent epimerase/dehydratase family protein [Elusimicrobiota bacterium]
MNTTAGIIQEDIAFIAAAPLAWEKLEGKTILISGANGMIPAYLVETILHLNDHRFTKKARVLGLVRNKEKALQRFGHHAGRSDLALVVQDVIEPARVSGDLHYIIHAASQASPKFYGQDPIGTFSANVFGTKNMLDLALQKQVKGFLFCSSSEVYGQVQDSGAIKETAYGYVDPANVRSCYAEGKRAGETLCFCWHHQHGVDIRIVRPFHTYGPGMSLDDGRVYADFIADIVNNRDIAMKSDGLAVRAFCYVADAAVGFFTVLLEGQGGQAYNVGNAEGNISILDLAQLLVSLFPEKNLRVKRMPAPRQGYLQSPVARCSPDTAKIGALGWEPKYSIEEGFTRTIRSFDESAAKIRAGI